MKLYCGPTSEEREAARGKWHRWFAWHPIRVASGDCRWLEPVERKGRWAFWIGGCDWVWEYRPIGGAA